MANDANALFTCAKLGRVSCSNSPVLPVDALEEVRADHPRHQTTRPSTVVDLRDIQGMRDAALESDLHVTSMPILGEIQIRITCRKKCFLDEQMCIPWLNLDQLCLNSHMCANNWSRDGNWKIILCRRPRHGNDYVVTVW